MARLAAVKATGSYPIAKDQWCTVAFEPLTTTALRLAVRLPNDWAAGAHEWRLAEVEE